MDELKTKSFITFRGKPRAFLRKCDGTLLCFWHIMPISEAIFLVLY